ncbi:MAG: hypothetical protein B6D59_01445 [Campylobacteraceae bacterium 4484_4]|nr:MAG: hypothetical protein B6D59_01445 [Campylobacteraceae bacterium 4484_4]
MSEPKIEEPRDEFEQRLDEALQELQSCQQEKGYQSCMQCSQIIGCELRNRYVKAVYISMNKGKGGGFEF